MAEEVVWPVNRMVAVNGLDPAEACLLPDAVATAHHALELAAVPPGGSLCVIGAGGVGTHVIELARILDPDVRVAAVVRREGTARRVEPLTEHVVTGLEDAARAVRKETGAIDAVIDFSGAAGATAQAVRMLKRGGTLVLGSVIDEPLGVGTTVTGVVARELVIRGVYSSGMRNLRAVAEMSTNGKLSLSDSVSHRFPLEAAPEAFRLAGERPVDIVRVVLEP
jgi:2-desacetyl-2-hydroxyethyl bacteriochlorophyllide A dehydrogenase